MGNEKSCGAVVFTRDEGIRKYVVIQERYQGAYGFPKGHMMPGETERETAVREVKEETGLDVVLHDGFRYVYEHSLALEGFPDSKKTNVYFLAEYKNQALHAQESEIQEVSLMDYGRAMRCIQSEEVRNLLRYAEDYLNAL